MTRVIQIFSSSIQVVHRFETAIGEAHLRPMLTVLPTTRSAKRPMRIANVEIRPAELQVLVDGRRAGLTVREFELFLLLSERLDSVVQRPEIYELMWGGEMPRRDRSVDVLVRKVRRQARAGRPRLAIHPHPLRRRLPLQPGTGITPPACSLPLGPEETDMDRPSLPRPPRAGGLASVNQLASIAI